MATSLEVLFSPAELTALAQRDLTQTVCVVFDVLRATSTMVTALANGATAVIPVAEIAEALSIRARQPDVVLAGERNGLRIRADLTGGIDFDMGNSPREFTVERVRGRTIVMSTTNGTRALRACRGAQGVWLGSFLNLSAVVRRLRQERPANLLAVCSGTLEQAALEDALGAGALCDEVWVDYSSGQVADSARMARQLYQWARADLGAALQNGRNGRRLARRPELRDDISVCAQRDAYDFVAEQFSDGAVRPHATRPSSVDG
jgi:2-phosphosulfolactate phosphatase